MSGGHSGYWNGVLYTPEGAQVHMCREMYYYVADPARGAHLKVVKVELKFCCKEQRSGRFLLQKRHAPSWYIFTQPNPIFFISPKDWVNYFVCLRYFSFKCIFTENMHLINSCANIIRHEKLQLPPFYFQGLCFQKIYICGGGGLQ